MTHTWKEATIRWLSEMKHKRTIDRDAYYFNYLNSFLADKTLEAITRDDIFQIIRDKEAGGAKSPTVNRILSLIRSLFNKAYREWGWQQTAPIYIKAKKENPGRIRWLKQEEIKTLYTNLPPHLKLMVELSLNTGLRSSNVLTLRWANVDLIARTITIPASEFKNGKEHTIPLNQAAIKVLLQLQGQCPSHVFSYNGHPITQCNTKAFRKALRLSNIQNFRWHDLRHTWASMHVQAGTPLHILQQLGGWSDIKMVLRYAHLDMKQLQQAADAI